jgi:probable HAF family extracellular repeat protein
MKTLFSILGSSLFVTGVSLGPSLNAATFTHLGYLPGGGSGSGGHGVSDDGKVVVGISDSSSGVRGYRWDAATGMAPLPGGGSYAADVSKDGKVVGGHANGEAVIWKMDGSMVALGNSIGGGLFTDIRDLNGDGSVVIGIGSTAAGFPQAMRWQNGVATALSDPPTLFFTTDAYGVSADGSIVVGGGNSANGSEGFRWQSSAIAGVGDLGGGIFQSGAIGISANGTVIVGYANNAEGTVASRLQNGVMESLGELPGGQVSATATSCSQDGAVIVGSSHTGISDPLGIGFEAFIWDRPHGIRNLKTVLETQYGLDLSGWILQFAEDISTNGKFIAGTAINPNGHQEAFLVELTTLDSDGDGIPDAMDSCPNSDTRATIIINGVNTTIANDRLETGCTLSDLISSLLAQNPKNSAIVDLLLKWKQEGLISGQEMGTIISTINSGK